MHLENSKNISISAKHNSSDIARFVQTEVDRLISRRLLLDGRVSSKYKLKLIETLASRAQGMFRWVEMSLEALKRIKFLPDFKKALGQLTSELSGLYDIIHTQIDKTETHGRDVAIQTLKWLLCAQRLLSAEELIAAVYQVDEDISSDSDEGPELGNDQLRSPENDILRLCRNLVVFDSEQASFRFAHQSVREYLLKRPQYTAVEQHTLATERCLDVYLTGWLEGSIVRRIEQQNEILRPYAEVYWPVHYKHVEDSTSNQLEMKVSRFTGRTQGPSLPYVQWISDIRGKYGDDRYSWQVYKKLGLSEDDRLGYKILLAASRPDTLLAAASAFGIVSFLKIHELALTDWNQCQESEMESHSLLSIAAMEGHEEVARLLLSKGADVNAQGGLYGNALQAASAAGHNPVVVQTLLDYGADVNAQGGYHENALQAASSVDNNPVVVQMLLDRGADVNAQGGEYGNALQAASLEGNDQIVQLLLNHGADINAQGGEYRNALQAASFVLDNHVVVQILLHHGADVNAQGGRYGNALQAASSEGNDQIVQLLLKHGADVNAQGRFCGNALQAASFEGNTQIVQLLLNHGADVNAQGGEYGNALYAASSEGNDQIVQLLLNHGADVNAHGGAYGSALQAASTMYNDEIVQLLLKHGAEEPGSWPA